MHLYGKNYELNNEKPIIRKDYYTKFHEEGTKKARSPTK
jgi:hypothetical protein